MDSDWVRDYCLSLPHTTETVQWGSDLVFKIGGKMYAVVALEPSPHWMSFKCSPELFAELSERPGMVPAPYLARAQWIALNDNSSMSPAEIRTMLRSAYELIRAKLPKKAQQALT